MHMIKACMEDEDDTTIPNYNLLSKILFKVVDVVLKAFANSDKVFAETVASILKKVKDQPLEVFLKRFLQALFGRFWPFQMQAHMGDAAYPIQMWRKLSSLPKPRYSLLIFSDIPKKLKS